MWYRSEKLAPTRLGAEPSCTASQNHARNRDEPYRETILLIHTYTPLLQPRFSSLRFLSCQQPSSTFLFFFFAFAFAIFLSLDVVRVCSVPVGSCKRAFFLVFAFFSAAAAAACHSLFCASLNHTPTRTGPSSPTLFFFSRSCCCYLSHRFVGYLPLLLHTRISSP